MLTKKYVVVGGMVASRSGDEGWHYLTPKHLCELYGVNPQECYLVDGSNPLSHDLTRDLPLLTPKWDGRYTLPKGDSLEIHKTTNKRTKIPNKNSTLR